MSYGRIDTEVKGKGLFFPTQKSNPWMFCLNIVHIIHSVLCDHFSESLLLLKFQLECLHRKYWQLQITPLSTSRLTPISFQHCLCLCRILKHAHTHTHTHTPWHTYTHGSKSLASCHTHFGFWGYQSAECKLSPPKTVTCRQRCLAPCGNPLSSWHKNKSLFPW